MVAQCQEAKRGHSQNGIVSYTGLGWGRGSRNPALGRERFWVGGREENTGRSPRY